MLLVILLLQPTLIVSQPPQHGSHPDFRRFMVQHQYKVMCISLVVGFIFVGLCRLPSLPWFLARLALLFAIIAFVPAGLVLLAHLREFGPFWWWDSSNVVWKTRRSRRVEKFEMIVLTMLVSVVFIFVVIVIFILSR
jgi:hypothetical protein